MKKSGDKYILDFKKISTSLLVLLIASVVIWITYEYFRGDNSTYRKESTPAPRESTSETVEVPHTPSITNEDRKLIDSKDNKRNRNKLLYKPPQLKYKAGQFIDLGQSSQEDKKANSMGTVVKAKLITSIDTREDGQICKAVIIDKRVPFLPYKTLIFGQAQLGGSKKALIVFDHALLPTGEELPIKAQAMSLKNNSVGIDGNFHGKMGTRAATTIGLTVISGMSEVLTEKQSFGGIQGNVVAKPNMKNALYNGMAKAAESEAQRQSEQLSQEPEYMTVDSGTEFNIQLLTKIKEEDI